MKRFDLRQIMRDAHRTYKYVGKKQGRKSWQDNRKKEITKCSLRSKQKKSLSKPNGQTATTPTAVDIQAPSTAEINKDINQDYPVRSRYRKQSVKGMAGTTWSDCPQQSVPESDTGAYPQSQHRGREN